MKATRDTQIGSDGTSGDLGDGLLSVVGVGPGGHAEMTVRAQEVVLDADRLVGARADLDRVPAIVRRDATVEPVDGDGRTRARRAVDRAADGERVALVSRDPNAYALAGAAFASAEGAAFDAEVVPGVSLARACAARLGAPLGSDAASLSLSDRLDDWETAESRLRAVAREGFPLVLSNPWTPEHRGRYERACDVLEAARPADTPVGIVATAEPERTAATTLSELRGYGETDLVDATATVVVADPDDDRWREWLTAARDDPTA